MIEVRVSRPFQCAVDGESGAVLIAQDGSDVRITFDDSDCAREFASNALDALMVVCDRELRAVLQTFKDATR